MAKETILQFPAPLFIGKYEDIPEEVRNGTDPVKVNSFYGGLIDGAIAVEDSALERLLSSNEAKK